MLVREYQNYFWRINMTEEMIKAFGEFQVEKGIYEQINGIKIEDFKALTSNQALKTIDLYCPLCKENKTFIYSKSEYINGLGQLPYPSEDGFGTAYTGAIRFLNYECPSCGKKLVYGFYHNGKASVTKITQYPSLFDVSRDELKKYQKNDLIDKVSFSQLYKAETCASSGYYVAAYTYMRRVYETMLLSVFKQYEQEIGITEDNFRKLRSDEKLKSIKNYLAIDDEIYIPLYGLLSAGIHAMTEEQCCEDYTVLKPILLEILAEQKAKKEKAAKRKELKELFAKRKGEMK